ncbi:hypothetical protein Misp01_61780 [Microtetraspora sp. NBRC 13810]|nr:hypothetical protein Misp01_61780 [Microtetraspora sp. NBRC 13810]
MVDSNEFVWVMSGVSMLNIGQDELHHMRPPDDLPAPATTHDPLPLIRVPVAHAPLPRGPRPVPC